MKKPANVKDVRIAEFATHVRIPGVGLVPEVRKDSVGKFCVVQDIWIANSCVYVLSRDTLIVVPFANVKYVELQGE